MEEGEEKEGVGWRCAFMSIVRQDPFWGGPGQRGSHCVVSTPLCGHLTPSLRPRPIIPPLVSLVGGGGGEMEEEGGGGGYIMLTTH